MIINNQFISSNKRDFINLQYFITNPLLYENKITFAVFVFDDYLAGPNQFGAQW